MSQTVERKSRRSVVEGKSQQARDLLDLASVVAWSGLSSGLDMMGAVQSALITSEAAKRLKEIEESSPKGRRIRV